MKSRISHFAVHLITKRTFRLEIKNLSLFNAVNILTSGSLSYWWQLYFISNSSFLCFMVPGWLKWSHGSRTRRSVSPARGESSPPLGWAELADKDVEGKLKSLRNRQPRESQSQQSPLLPGCVWELLQKTRACFLNCDSYHLTSKVFKHIKKNCNMSSTL